MIAGVSYERHVKEVVYPKIIENIPNVLPWKLHGKALSIQFKNCVIDGNPIHEAESKILLYGIGKNGDQSAFRSEEFDWAIVDEAVVCNQHAMKFIETRLGRKNPIGILAIVTTPDEPSHWLYDYLMSREFEIHTMKTMDNIHLDSGYIDTMRRDFPGAFGLRYLEGQWITVENAMFTQSGWQELDEDFVYPERMSYVAACDPATSKTGDYFAIAVLGKGTDDPRVFLVDMVCQQGVPIMEQLQHLERIQMTWNPTRFVVETVAYQDALRQLVEKRIPHIIGVKPEADKVIRAMRLSACWNNHNFYIDRRCLFAKSDRDKLRTQFLAFPAGDHDDIVDACVYAYKYLVNSTPTVQTPIITRYPRRY